MDFLDTYWKSLSAGDMEAFAPIVGENCIVHYPGNHFLSGDYHGRAAIVALYSKLYRIGIEQGTFIGELVRTLRRVVRRRRGTNKKML